MQFAEISCVKKSDRTNPWERILRVGGRGATAWSLSQEEVMAHIDQGTWGFYVSVQGVRVDVVVGVSRFGNKYLRTNSDGEQPNNLLSLPECP